jgi:hypothetical protein
MTQQRLLPDRLTTPKAAKLSSVADVVDLKGDLIYGVAAIQAELQLPTPKHVYRLREKTDAPIFIMPGMGIAARKSALRAWQKRIEDEDVAARTVRG